MSAPTDTTMPPGTITNPCYTWAIWLAAAKCRTISTQAKLKAYERQMQKQTGHDAKAKSMHKASMLNFEQPKRKPRACRDKKSLATTRDNHIRLCNMRLDILENSFKPSESRALLTLKMSKHTINRLIIQSDPISF